MRNQLSQNTAFPRKRESTRITYHSQLDPRFRGDDGALSGEELLKVPQDKKHFKSYTNARTILV
jgi:hypothetical protein